MIYLYSRNKILVRNQRMRNNDYVYRNMQYRMIVTYLISMCLERLTFVDIEVIKIDPWNEPKKCIEIKL